ncbi:MAG: class I tRNA ligase family protein, partial [Patescibacteria group bacterium]
MSVKYPEFSGLNLPAIEQEILAKWSKEQAFEKSVSLREGRKPFVFYEGPPSANGMPGIHHVISRTLKDMVCRYKTMQGFQVKRKGGWDTHGLPVELGVEKELGITKEDIGKKISVEEYNRKCREAVLRYKDKWDDLTNKMGYWVDLNDPYITFDNKYIETLWWILSELYKKGFLYESVSIQPYSPAAGTGLSSHELNQPGTYKDVKDTSAVAMFKAVRNDKSEFLFKEISNIGHGIPNGEVFFIAWTTTPWTFPGNVALSVIDNFDYVKIRIMNNELGIKENYILAKDRLVGILKDEKYKIIEEFKGKYLIGKKYKPFFDYYQKGELKHKQNGWKVYGADFVTAGEGTGIVHIAPAFGEDDMNLAQKENLPFIQHVSMDGRFKPEIKDFAGLYVKPKENPQQTDIEILKWLSHNNKLFSKQKISHAY